MVLILDAIGAFARDGLMPKCATTRLPALSMPMAEHLKLEHIDAVYSVPPYLPFLSPRIGSYFGVGSVYLCPM